jgi:sporulation protein YlmC with PRC-barrel domain
MIKKFFTVAAASTFLMAASGAYAQDATNTQNNATGTAPMTTQDPAAPAATGTTPAPDANTSAQSGATTNSTDTQETAATYLTEQGENQISANDYIGATVYNAKDESIGDINDLIIDKNGGIAAAVVGVGGFLGIGEKNVAVPMSNIMAAQKEDGTDLKLTTNETADTLKNAPEFKTLDQTNTAAGTMDPANETTGTIPNTDTTGGAMNNDATTAPAAGTTNQ